MVSKYLIESVNKLVTNVDVRLSRMIIANRVFEIQANKAHTDWLFRQFVKEEMTRVKQ